MATQIRPNRLEVSDRFPMLGFTVRTDGTAKRYEIAIGTSPEVFGGDGKSQRNRHTFYSTHASGPLSIERGEAVFVLPSEVLARFIGQQKLYYGLATFANGASTAEIASMPKLGSPYINIAGLTGRSLQRVRILPNRQRAASNYGKNGSEMEWAGDAATPGSQPTTPVAGKAPMTKEAAPPQGGAVHYDDGYGALPPAPVANATRQVMPQAGSLADDESDTTLYSIPGPIPDGNGAAAQGLARPMAMAAEYPQASRFEPAVDYKAVSGTRTINRIVIHITDGQAKINGTISWFQNPDKRNSKNRRIYSSAHYVVGQDGEVVQMVRNNDVAWHASSANGESIGIEHVARSPHEWNKNDAGLMPTEAEYCASAALVNWLCNQFNLPMDRQHIVGHNEASPGDGHTDCPDGVWDWDYYMGLVTSGTCNPMGATASSLAAMRMVAAKASSLGGGQSFDENWNEVDLVGQPDNASCWATAAAMVVGWRDRVSITIDAIKQMFGTATGLATNAGLSPDDRQKLADTLSLVAEPPQSYTVDGFRAILENYGPAWAGIRTDDGWGHAVVMTGIYGDGTPNGTYVRIHDPWGRSPGTPTRPGAHNPTPGQGSRYTLTFAEFEKEYEDRITSNGQVVNVQILHSADTGGRTINTGADQSYALAATSTPTQADGSHPHHHHKHHHHDDKLETQAPAAAAAADDEDSLHGIDGPIPDDAAAAQSLASAMAMSPEYPQASRFEQADGGNYRAVSSPRTINRIVIHITDGGKAINGTVGWFKNPAAKVSAHYVIGQDGEVVQMVRHNDVAWHASSANGDSIGIEHVANTRGLNPTPAEYCASAALVNWLCSQFNLPMDRTHVLGHSEADPKTSHKGCPNAVWDWDYYMGMVTSASCYDPQIQTQALSVRLPAPPKKRARAQGLDATSARTVAGSPVNTVTGTDGNVSWELDQFPGIKMTTQSAVAPLQSAETIQLTNWPYCDHAEGTRSCAWFKVDWKFSGQALGDIHITPAGAQQGIQPLRVEARIEDGKDEKQAGAISLAVRFTYHFATSDGPEVMAKTELMLYSDGSIDQKSNWIARAAA